MGEIEKAATASYIKEIIEMLAKTHKEVRRRRSLVEIIVIYQLYSFTILTMTSVLILASSMQHACHT